jgi:hypothetical protein
MHIKHIPMKKISFLLSLFSFTFLYCQNIKEVYHCPKPNGMKSTQELETTAYLKSISECIDRATNFTLFKYSNGGYVTGNNYDYDMFGMCFNLDNGPKVLPSNFGGGWSGDTLLLESVFFYPAHKRDMGSGDFFNIIVFPDFYINDYSNGTSLVVESGSPILKAHTIDDVDTSAAAGLNFFDFTTWPEENRFLTDSFLVTIDLTDFSDTLAIYTSDPATGDGQGEKRLCAGVFYSHWNDIVWIKQDDYMSNVGGFDADAMIGVIVKIGGNPPASVENSEKELGLNTQLFAHPKENSLLIVSYASGHTNYSLQLFDIGGKEVYNENVRENGVLNHTINTSKLQLGQYILSIKMDNGAVCSKSVFIR